MIGALFDSNIYGIIIEDESQGFTLADRIAHDKELVVHNFRTIRNELRRIPEILPLYDRIVTKRVIDETKQIKDLAQKYFEEYKKNYGVKNKSKILNDFKIVACATLINCDIFTEDKKTMQHPIALKAYKMVNSHTNKRVPTFYSYKDLKTRYL